MLEQGTHTVRVGLTQTTWASKNREGDMFLVVSIPYIFDPRFECQFSSGANRSTQGQIVFKGHDATGRLSGRQQADYGMNQRKALNKPGKW